MQPNKLRRTNIAAFQPLERSFGINLLPYAVGFKQIGVDEFRLRVRFGWLVHMGIKLARSDIQISLIPIRLWSLDPYFIFCKDDKAAAPIGHLGSDGIDCFQ
jgi:hypothetical protein